MTTGLRLEQIVSILKLMIVNTKIGVDLLQLRQLLQIHTQQFFSLVILEQEQILWAVSKKKKI